MKRIAFLTALIAVAVWACSDKGSEPKDIPPADNPPGAPVIDSLSTDRGYVDDSLDIYGENFGENQDSASSVMFGSVHARVIFWTDTRIGIRVPEDAKTGNLSVTVDTLSSNNVSFIVYGIDHIEPDSGRVGSEVRIHGVRFGYRQYGDGVTFGGIQAEESYWSDTLIVTTVPEGATTGLLKIEMLNRDYSAGVFIVPGSLGINELDPDWGPWRTEVSIHGDGFGETQGSSKVMFDSKECDIYSWSSTMIISYVPDDVQSGEVAVLVDGVFSNELYFEVFRIANIIPAHGERGDTVIISGDCLGEYQSGCKVSFGEDDADIVSWSNSSITVIIPDNAHSSTVQAHVGDVASNGLPFAVEITPEISSIQPDHGTFGTEVTISGIDFGDSQGSGGAFFNGVEAVIASWSESEISAKYPFGCTSGDIAVTVDGRASNPVPFTVFGIISINPTWGDPGDSVTISGTGFGSSQGANYVQVDGITADVVTWSDDSIVVLIPERIPRGELNVVINGTSSNTVKIGTGFLGLLYQTNCASVVFSGYNCYKHCYGDFPPYTNCDTGWQSGIVTSSNYYYRAEDPLIWVADTFTVFHEHSSSSFGTITKVRIRITGVVSDDEASLVNVSAARYFSYFSDGTHMPSGQSEKDSLDVNDISLEASDPSSMTFQFRVVGPASEQHIVSLDHWESKLEFWWDPTEHWELIDTDWDNEQYPPEIKITLEYRP